MKLKEHIPTAVGLSLSGFSLWLGTYDPLWGLVGVQDANIRSGLTMSTSLICLLLGYGISLSQSHDNFITMAGSLIVNSMAQAARITGMRVLSCEDAMNELVGYIRQAKHVHNTRVVISSGGGNYSTSGGKNFERALKAAVRSGLHLREVVSSGWKQHAHAMATELNPTSGNYAAKCIDPGTAPFLNFIAIEMPSGERFVYFGWIMSEGLGFEQNCFTTSEPRIVQYFTSWHADLYRRGGDI
ncbi:MAG: hypothetical protein HY077_01400 [Elusimicrobia bacterium]|nr:hypothetical protein [Elusimicrobiota bacterium]